MKCKFYTVRSKKYTKYQFCRLKKQIIHNECTKCSNFCSREYHGIKNKSSKQQKLEKNRDRNLMKKGICQNCGNYDDRLDPHEIYGGANRKRSIENGFVKLICRNCHNNERIVKELRKETQIEFEKKHTREEFIKIIGKSYL